MQIQSISRAGVLLNCTVLGPLRLAKRNGLALKDMITDTKNKGFYWETHRNGYNLPGHKIQLKKRGPLGSFGKQP